jgi:5-formyltetrahydrofolate cyclo-ligase
MTKTLVRKHVLESRKIAFDIAAKDVGIAPLLEVISNLKKIKIIAGYMPINTEINPLLAMQTLFEAGKGICVPIVQSAGMPLIFREWEPTSKMFIGAFGAKIPENGELVEPDLLIVPLVAFDRSGARLGYGGGFYDRTLEKLRKKKKTIAIGFAYAAQEIFNVPTETTDQYLDIVITENEIIYFNK